MNVPGVFVVQGLIEDAAASNPFGSSVTNAPRPPGGGLPGHEDNPG